MTHRSPSLFAALFALTLAALAGCSDQYAGRMTVSGTVKLEGQPLSDARILFDPLDNQGTQSGAPIVDGEYQVPRDAGLKPGKYLVRITAGDGKTPTNEQEAGGPSNTNIVSIDRVPDEWNVKSEKQVEITASGPNKFDFEIPKANPKAGKPRR
jgi:hypothetical protein